MKKVNIFAVILSVAICATSLTACSFKSNTPPQKEAFTSAAETQKLTVNDGIQLAGSKNLKATISAENADDSFVALYVQAADAADALTVYENQVTTCLSCTGMSKPSKNTETDKLKTSQMVSDKGYAYVCQNNDTVIVVLTKPQYQAAATTMLKTLKCENF